MKRYKLGKTLNDGYSVEDNKYPNSPWPKRFNITKREALDWIKKHQKDV